MDIDDIIIENCKTFVMKLSEIRQYIEIKYNIYCQNNEYKEIEFVISFKAIVCNKLLLFFQFSIDFLAHKTIINEQLKINWKGSISTNH